MDRAAAGGAVTVAAACLLGADVIHTAAMPAHLREWWAAGAFFLAVALLEGAVAAALLLLPSRRLARAAVGVSLATAAVWAWSRSLGVPFGPDAWVREPVGRADSIATLLEAATAIALVPLARGRGDAAPRPVSGRLPRSRPAVVAIVALLTAFGASGLEGDGEAHGHDPDPRAPAAVLGSEG